MFKKKWFNVLMIGTIAVLSLSALAFAPFDANRASGPGGKGGPSQNFGENQYLADALGITVEELQAAMEAVRSNNAGPGSDFSAALATALGISADELAAAQQSAHTAALEQALADGEITQEEYDNFIARQALQGYLNRETMLATALGMSAEELQTALAEGQRIPDLLEEQGISQEDFQAAMQAAQHAALDEAVADGVITQEQADQIGSGEFHGPNDGPQPGGRPGNRGPEGGRRPGGNNNDG